MTDEAGKLNQVKARLPRGLGDRGPGDAGRVASLGHEQIGRDRLA